MSFVYLSRFFKLLSLFVNALAVFCQSSLQSTEPGDALQPRGGHREGRVVWAEILYCSPHRCHQGGVVLYAEGGLWAQTAPRRLHPQHPVLVV